MDMSFNTIWWVKAWQHTQQQMGTLSSESKIKFPNLKKKLNDHHHTKIHTVLNIFMVPENTMLIINEDIAYSQLHPILKKI